MARNRTGQGNEGLGGRIKRTLTRADWLSQSRERHKHKALIQKDFGGIYG